MLVITDTFDYEDYEVFAYGELDLERKKEQYSKNMQRVRRIEEIK